MAADEERSERGILEQLLLAGIGWASLTAEAADSSPTTWRGGSVSSATRCVLRCAMP